MMQADINVPTEVFVTYGCDDTNRCHDHGYKAVVKLGPRGWVEELSPHDDHHHRWEDILFYDTEFANGLRPWPGQSIRTVKE